MRRAVFSASGAATEVLANTARQYHKVRKLRQVHPGPAHRPRPAANTSKELSDRDKWSQFIGGMLGAFLQPGPLLTRQC